MLIVTVALAGSFIIGLVCLATAFAYHGRVEDVVRQAGRDRYDMDTHPSFPKYWKFMVREARWGVPGLFLTFGSGIALCALGLIKLN